MSNVIDYGNVIVCAPTMRESSRTSEGVKWCFTCRARHEFWSIIEVPTTLEGWYWGPTARVECEKCHTVDGDCFPGTYREWE